MIEGIYFYGDQLRWNLGWPNPNVAGAFVAMLLAFAFSLSFSIRGSSLRTRMAKGFLFLSELALCILLCKTYSRGALLALGMSACFFYGIQCLSSRCRSVCIALLPRIVILLGVLAATGFWSRMAPAYVQADASVGNRWTLWKAGMEMMTHLPWSGWGVGESGRQFMHWFQPVEETAAVAGMVNSYLHIGVERGLGVLFFWVVLGAFGVMLPLLCGILDRNSVQLKRWNYLILAAGSLVVVFLTANVFSTLWIFPGLWIPVFLGCIGMTVGVVMGYRSQLRRYVGYACSASILTGLIVLMMVYGSGRFLRNQRSMTMEFEGSWVRFPGGSSSAQPGHMVPFFPSPEVFGEDWGKEVRRLAAATPEREWSIVVPWKKREADPPHLPAFSGSYDIMTSSLRAEDNQGLLGAARNIILLHPTGRPPREVDLSAQEVQLFLPSLDISGTAGLWKRAAKQQGWDVVNSGAFSQDIRSVWPEIILEQIHPE
jgi:hypothetical protein